MQHAVTVGTAMMVGALAGRFVDRWITWSLEGRTDLGAFGRHQTFSHLGTGALLIGRIVAGRRTAMMVCSAVLFGLTVDVAGATPAAVALCFYVAVGLALSYTDLRFYLLPDRIVLPSIAVGVGLEIAAHPPLWGAVLLGSAGGFALFYALALLRPGALGGGDVKLMAFVGAATGLFGLFQSVVLGAVAAGVVVIVLWRAKVIVLKRESYIPYGPYFIWAAYVLVLGQHGPVPL